MSTVIVTTEDKLEELLERGIKRAFELAGIKVGRADEPMPVAKEVTNKIARKILTEKGYPVKSLEGLKSVLSAHNVVGTMRGRDMWYNGADIASIPDRK